MPQSSPSEWCVVADFGGKKLVSDPLPKGQAREVLYGIARRMQTRKVLTAFEMGWPPSATGRDTQGVQVDVFLREYIPDLDDPRLAVGVIKEHF